MKPNERNKYLEAMMAARAIYPEDANFDTLVYGVQSLIRSSKAIKSDKAKKGGKKMREVETSLVSIKIYPDRVDVYENGRKLDNVSRVELFYDGEPINTKVFIGREPVNGKMRLKKSISEIE